MLTAGRATALHRVPDFFGTVPNHRVNFVFWDVNARNQTVKYDGCPPTKHVVCVVPICRVAAAQGRGAWQQKIGRGRTVITEWIANRDISQVLFKCSFEERRR